MYTYRVVASENEKKVHAARGHVKISETGVGRLWGNEAGEHVQGVMSDFVGHHFRNGKEALIANVGWHLQRLSEVCALQSRGPERPCTAMRVAERCR
jgi:hypothetical protein